MERERTPESVVALYAALADVEAALRDLQAAQVAYPDIRMGAHSAGDAERPALDVRDPPELFWSLAVVLDEPIHDRVAELLARHQPFAVGRAAAPHAGRSDTDRGALAWRHYVFETTAASAGVTEASGTTGTTGVISSGVFADGARAEGNPPVRGLPGSHDRPPAEDQRPTSDDREQEVGSGRSRPQTELKP